MIGLYIHVPFCRSRCHFCAFYLQIYREDRAQDYLAALFQEIRLHAGQQTLSGRRLDTVYFGGGTPTALQPSELCGILSCVQANFGLQPHAEITVEAHPDTVTADGLAQLAKTGFNRISFGVQSLDENELVTIGRPFLPERAYGAVALARQAGFTNINLDFIFGLPGQTLESWHSTLDQAIALDPNHLSCYALTVEEGTRLIVDIRRGDRTKPEDLLQNTMEEEAFRELSAVGFDRYEISNYCRPGYACRHNKLYWEGGDYLGIGPSAQSYVGGNRFGDVEDLHAYQNMLAIGRLPTSDSERLSPEQQRREAIVFGLRLTEGVPSESVHGHEMDAEWKAKMVQLLNEGWLEETEGRIRMTPAGRRFADSVAVDLL
ncbi:MAG: radical SAM family heme chaperone HemW [Nitrospirales bacterium]|nr:radical SAM family heme chaperone HemW [Nitrospirales bacterium]